MHPIALALLIIALSVGAAAIALAAITTLMKPERGSKFVRITSLLALRKSELRHASWAGACARRLLIGGRLRLARANSLLALAHWRAANQYTRRIQALRSAAGHEGYGLWVHPRRNYVITA